MPDTLTPNTSVAGQVSYTFGAGETVNPGTNLTITGNLAGGGTATIVAPMVTAGESVGTAGPPATGYVAALQTQIAAAGITGVTVTNTGGVLPPSPVQQPPPEASSPIRSPLPMQQERSPSAPPAH